MFTFCMTVVSIRIDEKVKKTLERAGVNISKEVKRYLEELAWRIELREAVEEISKLLEEVPPAEEGFSVRSVREDRESHRFFSPYKIYRQGARLEEGARAYLGRLHHRGSSSEGAR